MSTVKQAMDAWGADYMRASAKVSVPVGASITFEEDIPMGGGCETCGPDPITVTLRWERYSAYYYGSLGEIIQEILKHEAAAARPSPDSEPRG